MRIILVLTLTFLMSCRKKAENQSQNDHPVPYVPIAMNIYPNDPLHFALQNIGGWKYLDGGIQGLVIYRKSDHEFVALERASPESPDDVRSRAVVLADNFSLSDTISGSTWRIFDGVVTKGPAKWPLRRYGTSYDGNLLRISN